MKALETHYKGYRFRSRTEARWAVFMDALGVPYEYEPNAFELGGMTYLPDFFLTSGNCYLEIKPKRPTIEEQEKAERLALLTGCNVYVFWGPPEVPERMQEDGLEGGWVFFPEHGCDYFHHWCVCPECGSVGIQYDGRCERNECGCIKDENHTQDHPRIVYAVEKSRGYRFEPGAYNP